MPDYKFVCPKCGKEETIEMRMSEYKADGHECPECGTELQRDVRNMGMHYSDKTGSFYQSSK